MNKSTIWPEVMARMSTAAIKATRPRISREAAEWIRAFLIVLGATAVSVAIIAMTW